MKLLYKTTSLLILTLVSISFAQTTLEVRFIESAPKDRFVISNLGECNLSNFVLTIDLTDSKGKLIFDTTETGAGVEVFQPFEVTEGNIELASTDFVNDGDTILSLKINELDGNTSSSFTIDLDDTLENSDLGMIRVTGAEIADASIIIKTVDEQSFSALFNDKSRASLALTKCF